MPYIQAPDRQQLTFMSKLDDLIAPDHPVRLLDAVVERIIADETDFFDHLAPGEGAGRPGYPAGCLIKLLLYGYIHRISSSRALAAEATRNIEVIWLLASLAPSYKTIADYRKDHPDQIARVNEAVVRLLIDGGWIDGQRVAVDGAKLKAYTGWQMSDADSLDRQLERARRQLAEWLEVLAANDLAEEWAEITDQQASGEQVLPASEPEVMAEIGRLAERIERLEALREQLAEARTARISPADPEARLMRSGRYGKFPAYNLQAGVDGAHHMILSARMTNEANDLEQLGPMHTEMSMRLGAAPAELLADTGYADLGDIKQIQTETATRCYIPENDTTAAGQPVQFSYEPAADRYRCSAGRTLAPVAKGQYRKDKDAYVDLYRGTNCGGCPMSEQCTRAADGVRQIKVFHGAVWRETYRRQLASRYGQARIAERKTVVEHVFGTLRYWMGQIPLKLRGLRKVQTEIDLYAAGYNLKRWFGLGPFRELMAEVTGWQGAATLGPG